MNRTSLGIRNNNPFNIKYNNINKWKGQTGFNKGFCVFSDMEFGLRAGIYLLRKYINVYKLKSVKEIIGRFAPPSENATSAYISYVSNYLGVRPDSQINEFLVKDLTIFYNLCSAICYYESWFRLTYEEFSRVYNKYFK